jgi:integrase/recombinase XerC
MNSAHAHQYEGTHNSRSVRKWSKLVKGQPEPVALTRLLTLLDGLQEGTRPKRYEPFNPPRVVSRDHSIDDRTERSSTRRRRAVIPNLREDAMTLTEACRRCATHLDTYQKRSPATISNYSRTWAQFVAHLRGRGLADDPKHFTSENVMGFLEYLGAKPIEATGSTLANKLHALSALAKYMVGVKDGRGRVLLKENPTKSVARPKESKPETTYLRDKELEKFIDQPCASQVALVRKVLLFTWLRRMEAVEANVGDFFEENGGYFIRVKVKGRRQKGAEPATIPVDRSCADMLTDSLIARNMPDADEPLLVNLKGKRWTVSQMTQAMIRLGKKAGITRTTASPHRLRHTGATVANAEGVDMITLAALLNHSSTRHVARYAHAMPKRLAAVREQQAAMYSRYMGTNDSKSTQAVSDDVARHPVEKLPLTTSKRNSES